MLVEVTKYVVVEGKVPLLYVSGLETDFPCGVWGRGWTTCFPCDGPILGLGF